MLQLRRLSQAGFVVRAGGTTLVIDAFVSPRADRLVPPTVTPTDLAGADAILATHEHRDHLDPDLESIAAASPAATVIVPAPIADAVRVRVPAHRVVAAVVGEPIAIGATRVFPVPARHGVTMADAYGFGPAPGRPRFPRY